MKEPQFFFFFFWGGGGGCLFASLRSLSLPTTPSHFPALFAFILRSKDVLIGMLTNDVRRHLSGKSDVDATQMTLLLMLSFKKKIKQYLITIPKYKSRVEIHKGGKICNVDIMVWDTYILHRNRDITRPCFCDKLWLNIQFFPFWN